VHWLDQAHQADLAEVAVGQLAVSNASTPAIRSVGATLVRQHAAFDSRVIAAASKLKIPLVTYLTTDQAIAGDRLSKENGPPFDYDFTATMLEAHRQMIAATQAEIRRGSSPVVISLAQQALPMLEMHLRMLQSVAGSG
jgi:putative membrane protein